MSLIRDVSLSVAMLALAQGAVVAQGAASGSRGAAPSIPRSASGLQDPAWAPDGKRVAVSYLDRIWTMSPEGRQPKALTAGGADIEWDPAWSSDGTRIAFASRRDNGFDIYWVSAAGGTPIPVTTMPGDERWPSWTADGRVVFAHRGAPPARSTHAGLRGVPDARPGRTPACALG